MNDQHGGLRINDVFIKPGERTTIILPMPKLYDWTPLNMLVHVIHSRTPGPTLCVTAAIHGDEINGVEIIRRLLQKPILKKLSGTLIAVPILNVYGFLYQNRYLMDRRDLNRAFPGSQKGSLAARLAHLATKELLSKATHFIDLHTGSQHRENLPQIRTNLDMPGTKALAEAFNIAVILHAKERDGSLRQAANDKSIPCLLYEAGEALRFDEFSIRTGIKGITNVMRALHMLPTKKQSSKKILPAIARSSYWVRAPFSGILRPFIKLGKKVNKGELLAIIANPSGNGEHQLKSPLAGIIIGKSNLPLVHEGAALFHIACFEELKQVEKQIEHLQQSIAEYIELHSEYIEHNSNE